MFKLTDTDWCFATPVSSIKARSLFISLEDESFVTLVGSLISNSVASQFDRAVLGIGQVRAGDSYREKKKCSNFCFETVAQTLQLTDTDWCFATPVSCDETLPLILSLEDESFVTLVDCLISNSVASQLDRAILWVRKIRASDSYRGKKAMLEVVL